MVGGVLHQCPCHVFADTHLLVSVYLYVAHVLEHDLVATQVDSLHVEEGGHVAVERYMCLTERVGQLVGEVAGEVDDAMHFLLTQQLLGLDHGGTCVREPDVGCSVPFMQESAALRRVAEVHDGDRNIGYLLVPIDDLVDEGIGQCGDQENGQHAGVAKDATQFIYHLFKYHFFIYLSG